MYRDSLICIFMLITWLSTKRQKISQTTDSVHIWLPFFATNPGLEDNMTPVMA